MVYKTTTPPTKCSAKPLGCPLKSVGSSRAYKLYLTALGQASAQSRGKADVKAQATQMW